MRTIFISIVLMLLCSCTKIVDAGSSAVDISSQFQLAHSAQNEHQPMDVLFGKAGLDFHPLDYPQDIAEFGKDSWLKARLRRTDMKLEAGILELPGQLFGQVDIWFELADGETLHDRAGTWYPYVERKVKHAGVAFFLPPPGQEPVNVLIRMRSNKAMPVNFTALLWTQESWSDYVFNQRVWYGVFLGAILILVINNIFLAFSFRDNSYFFYVGYILCLAFIAILVSGLAEEYLWPSGKLRSYILLPSGLGIFFVVNFANTFLNIKQLKPSWYWASSMLSITALVFGVMIVTEFRVPLIPDFFITNFMHILTVLGGAYFIAASLGSYMLGMKQARFLALSMLALLGGMVIYFLYTHGVIKYNVYVVHAMEVGTLIEGVLLSLALSDRINLLSSEKERVEREALAAHRTFSKRLIQAQEMDREVFSNTMHDSIGHGMLVLKQNLDKLASSDSPTQNTSRADELRRQAAYCGEILDEVRRISHDLHPHLLKRLGLKSAIESTVEMAFSTQSIEWQADIGDVPRGINKEREIVIYRVIQECLNNILKHADATEVIIALSSDNKMIRVNIKDDGKGIDPGEASEIGQGLYGMKDRVELFGGWFSIESRLDVGTHISFGLAVT